MAMPFYADVWPELWSPVVFTPVGVHHANNLNAFNLADDVIEPFGRLLIKWYIPNSKIWQRHDLIPADKQKLIAVLTEFCSFHEGKNNRFKGD